MLEGRDLTKSYADRVVLRRVDVDVRPGSITAVIGPSGGGKTTLLRLLCMLETPDSGVVTVDGKACDARAWGRPAQGPWPEVTVVFQQLFLWPHLTLRQNMELPHIGGGSDAARVIIERLLDLLSLRDAADRYPNQTSLGQRQRAAFIRAVALQPRYLLLDEITSALDVEHIGLVLEELERLRASGVGILLVTHLIGFAAKSADQILFLADNEVVEAGPPGILAAPCSKRLAKFLSLVRSAS